MKDKFTRKSYLKATAMALICAAAIWAIYSKPSVGATDPKAANLEKLGLKDFIASEITYNGVMHELYWHYEFANQLLRTGAVEDARAHLKVMSFYINIVPYLQGDPKFFKTPESRKAFDGYAEQLLVILDKIQKGDTAQLGPQMQKEVAAMCEHCHKSIRTPIKPITPYGQKITLGK